VSAELRAARRVVPDRLRFVAPDNLPTGKDAVELGLGQERAIAALRLGATLRGRGYNVFAAGPRGSGRMRSTKELLSRLAAERPVPPDRAYVHNFAAPDQPRLLTLPPGRAAAFRRSMERLVELLRVSLPAFFDDEIVVGRRRVITDRHQRREAELFREFTAEAEARGFTLVKVQAGQASRPEVVPMHEGNPVSFDQLRQLASEEKLSQEELFRKEVEYDQLRDRLAELVRSGREVGREMNLALEKMVREEANSMLESPLGDIEEDYDNVGVSRFLQHVREDVIEMLTAPFVGLSDREGPNLDEHLARYRVNVVADRSGQGGAPVVVENYPTMMNLFGTVSSPTHVDGSPPRPPSALDISGGTLLEADGGFLILRARDMGAEPGVWDALKRTLSTSMLEIQRAGVGTPMFMPAPPLKPEPVPIDVRVVLVGEPSLYDLLWSMDPDFRSAFKVKAEFDPVLPRTDEAIGQFRAVLDELCAENGLRIVEPDAAARVLEWSARQAGGRGKMLARFGDIEDLLREADYESGRAESSRVEAEHVDAALAQRRTRNGLIEERALELMADDVVRIEVGGEVVGQVNGLSVLDLGYHRFGKPTRITATASVGRAGIINIEREARLSGGIYDKGVLIITGWLRRRYAQDRSLTLTASVCFEQSYAGVDGDSASIAEIIALLSELSGLPVDQAVAVTGSVDQHGGLQPIGGLNEKVEGFYDVCRARGLSGDQGVMFPESNIGELNLREDVADEVEVARFSLYALQTLEDAIEIALNVPMEEVDRRVVERLEAYGEALSEGAADLPPTPTLPVVPVTPAAEPPSPPDPVPG